MAFSRQYLQCCDERRDFGKSLNEQRSDGELCDVTLVAANERFPAHKCVLSAASQYFRSMFAGGSFAESSSSEIELFSVDKGALDLILKMIYLGVLTLDLA